MSAPTSPASSLSSTWLVISGSNNGEDTSSSSPRANPNFELTWKGSNGAVCGEGLENFDWDPIDSEGGTSASSECFPDEIVKLIGEDTFDEAPVYDFSDKKITDLTESDLKAPCILFSTALREYFGIIKQTEKDGQSKIDVYYSKEDSEEWYHLQLDKILMNRARLETLVKELTSTEMGNHRMALHEQIIYYENHLRAALKPSLIDLKTIG